MSKCFSNRIMVLALMIAAIGLSNGCVTNYGKAGQLNSFLAGGYPPSAISLVADDLAARLAEIYPPGHTQVYLKQTEGQNDLLGPAIDQSLRARGFIMAAEPASKILTVAYVFDRADETSWYSRLTVSSGLTIARTYRQNGEALEMMGISRNDQAGRTHDSK